MLLKGSFKVDKTQSTLKKMDILKNHYNLGLHMPANQTRKGTFVLKCGYPEILHGLNNFEAIFE